MNRSDYLGDMIDAGVTSFKIEGRLKDASYVKNITAWYRKKLDEAINSREGFSRSSDGISDISFIPDPNRSFNRGKRLRTYGTPSRRNPQENRQGK